MHNLLITRWIQSNYKLKNQNNTKQHAQIITWVLLGLDIQIHSNI